MKLNWGLLNIAKQVSYWVYIPLGIFEVQFSILFAYSFIDFLFFFLASLIVFNDISVVLIFFTDYEVKLFFYIFLGI